MISYVIYLFLLFMLLLLQFWVIHSRSLTLCCMSLPIGIILAITSYLKNRNSGQMLFLSHAMQQTVEQI